MIFGIESHDSNNPPTRIAPATIIPALYRAVKCPEWFKSMPQKAFSGVLEIEQLTVKKCPPFIDAMAYGYLIPLVADLRVENGTFSWEREVPSGALSSYSRSPIDFHDNNQVIGTPLFEADRFLIKFTNFWTIELPPGYSLLVTHPINRHDLPFITLTGMVDADLYRDNFINSSPARWRDADFNGVLAKGTPIAQCIPFKRDTWNERFGTIDGDAVGRLQEVATAVANEPGVYRRRFRAPKH